METCLAAAVGDAMRDFMAVAKALADENRVRLLVALRAKELCVCQLIELVRLAPSTVSKHMSILKQARLVDSRKEGRWIYYRLPAAGAPAVVRQAIEWVFRSLDAEPQVVCDRERLEKILELDPHDLCDRQSASPPKCGNREVATTGRRK
jgi:ArsR family transcriptional regulator